MIIEVKRAGDKKKKENILFYGLTASGEIHFFSVTKSRKLVSESLSASMLFYGRAGPKAPKHKASSCSSVRGTQTATWHLLKAATSGSCRGPSLGRFMMCTKKVLLDILFSCTTQFGKSLFSNVVAWKVKPPSTTFNS